MNTIEAIKSRRSIKQFDPNFQMTNFEKEQLISLSMPSLSAFNAQTLMLSANPMGYNAYPMVGFDFNKVAKLITWLPESHAISMFVAIGKAPKAAWNRPRLELNNVMAADMFANHQDRPEQCPEY